MSNYEAELEKRIETLESLWVDDTKHVIALQKELKDINNSIKEFGQYVLTLQNPDSSTNKHGEEVYQQCIEKTNSQIETVGRRINALNMALIAYTKMSERC